MDGKRWIFTKDQLANTPSRNNGIHATKELFYRQLTASLIQNMGGQLELTQQCINTAIIYMHRFYMFHSFARFPPQQMAQACIFLAAKTEDQWRKAEHVVRAANGWLHQAIDVKNETYLKQANTLVSNEEILLQTLGFEVTVTHAQNILLKTCQLIHASKDLTHTSYFLATNCLHLTTFCLQYKPSLVACICILLACQWSNWEIPKSSEGKEWYYYVDKNITLEILEEGIQEFLNILDKSPSKLKKIMENKKAAGTKRTIKDELPSEAPPMKRQRLENISPAATMAGSSLGGKSHVNRGLPIPTGHEQKMHSQQQRSSSVLLTSSRTVNKLQQQQPPSQAPISCITKSHQVEHIKRLLSDSGSLQMASSLAEELQTKRTKPNSVLTSSRTVNKVQQQQPPSQAPISCITKSHQVEHIKRLLSDSGSLQMASSLAEELQTKRTKPNSMHVKAYLNRKELDHTNENVQPQENRHHAFKVPNIPTKQEPVPNIQFKMGISSNVNTINNLKRA